MDGKRDEFHFQGKRFWFLGPPAWEKQNRSLDLGARLGREVGWRGIPKLSDCVCPDQSPVDSPELLSSYRQPWVGDHCHTRDTRSLARISLF